MPDVRVRVKHTLLHEIPSTVNTPRLMCIVFEGTAGTIVRIGGTVNRPTLLIQFERTVVRRGDDPEPHVQALTMLVAPEDLAIVDEPGKKR